MLQSSDDIVEDADDGLHALHVHPTHFVPVAHGDTNSMIISINEEAETTPTDATATANPSTGWSYYTQHTINSKVSTSMFESCEKALPSFVVYMCHSMCTCDLFLRSL